jgi:hypothetical protein
MRASQQDHACVAHDGIRIDIITKRLDVSVEYKYLAMRRHAPYASLEAVIQIASDAVHQAVEPAVEEVDTADKLGTVAPVMHRQSIFTRALRFRLPRVPYNL